jgi:hypothetical protein
MSEGEPQTGASRTPATGGRSGSDPVAASEEEHPLHGIGLYRARAWCQNDGHICRRPPTSRKPSSDSSRVVNDVEFEQSSTRVTLPHQRHAGNRPQDAKGIPLMSISQANENQTNNSLRERSTYRAPEDAAIAAEWLGVSEVIPVHYAPGNSAPDELARQINARGRPSRLSPWSLAGPGHRHPAHNQAGPPGCRHVRLNSATQSPSRSRGC